jgi:predicted nucleic acid-binding protein
MYLLDTDVLIDIQRAYAPALTWFATLTELPTGPGLVVMELIQDTHDALIAACAIGLSATLCTFNVKHYRVVPGLVMIQPYTR